MGGSIVWRWRVVRSSDINLFGCVDAAAKNPFHEHSYELLCQSTLRLLLLLLLIMASWAPADDKTDDRAGLVKVTVGIDRRNIRGADQRALQMAVDYVARLGGGTIHVAPGRYEMRNALTLRDNIHIQGTPGKTILVAGPGRQHPGTRWRLQRAAGHARRSGRVSSRRWHRGRRRPKWRRVRGNDSHPHAATRCQYIPHLCTAVPGLHGQQSRIGSTSVSDRCRCANS